MRKYDNITPALPQLNSLHVGYMLRTFERRSYDIKVFERYSSAIPLKKILIAITHDCETRRKYELDVYCELGSN